MVKNKVRKNHKFEAVPPPLVDFDFGYFFDKYSITPEGWLTRDGKTRAGIKRADGAWRVEIKGKRYSETALLWLREHDYWPDTRVHFLNGKVDECRMGNIYYERAIDYQDQMLMHAAARKAYAAAKAEIKTAQDVRGLQSIRLPHVRARKTMETARHKVVLWEIEGKLLKANLDLAMVQLLEVEKDEGRRAALKLQLRQLRAGNVDVIDGGRRENKGDAARHAQMAVRLDAAEAMLKRHKEALLRAQMPGYYDDTVTFEKNVAEWQRKVDILRKGLGIEVDKPEAAPVARIF